MDVSGIQLDVTQAFKYNTLYRFNDFADGQTDIVTNLNTTLCIGSIGLVARANLPMILI